ncbi:hypothetical protein [Microbulbifer epialgicus]|uniref:Uncharacterized protein n=1 Tax=Microbulbifer epialgicus TaxID=393907 RepID=A0ABV4NWP6_9GAMM
MGKAPKVIPNALWGGLAGCVVSHGSPQGVFRFIVNFSKYLFLHGTRLIRPETTEYVCAESLPTAANAKSSKRNVLQTPYWGHGYKYIDPTHGEQDNHSYYLDMQQRLPEVWGAKGHFIEEYKEIAISILRMNGILA